MKTPGNNSSRIFQYSQQILGALDWLFPPECAGCNRKGFHWCSQCQAESKWDAGNNCAVCALPVVGADKCVKCASQRPLYAASRSWGPYNGHLRKAILRLKYRRNVRLGQVLSEHLSQLLDHTGWAVDLLIPVPLSAERRRERGYNQSELLGYPLAQSTGIPYLPRALKRIKNTPSQIGLSINQRRENVHKAFKAQQNLALERNVLIVDDVMTTGATLDACAQALMGQGVENVFGLTLARTIADRHGEF